MIPNTDPLETYWHPELAFCFLGDDSLKILHDTTTAHYLKKGLMGRVLTLGHVIFFESERKRVKHEIGYYADWTSFDQPSRE